ncbi:MAG TPA: hypothetical protein VGK48_26375 [Terriglobia bacterium]
MQVWQIGVLAVVIVLLVLAIAWAVRNRQRSQHLRTRFGSEYDRTVVELGDRRRAESELMRREERVQHMNIHPLNIVERQKFLDQWITCQSLFVDDPGRAVEEADRLLTDVMRVRGYSIDNSHDRIRDVCLTYPRHAENYRRADEVIARHRRGQASTEELRSVFIHYRALFDEILGGRDEELKRAS